MPLGDAPQTSYDDSGLRLKVDLHVHSDASHDGRSSVESILERASEIGLDAIAITDHDSITESLHAHEIASEYDIISIPGVEISTSDGHLLALGIDDLPEIGMPIDETVEKVRDLGGLAVVPHPFQRTRHGAGKVDDCDAIEVYNSRLLTGRSNRKAKKYAEKKGFTQVGGSDAHTVSMVGRTYTEIITTIDSKIETSEKVLESLRQGISTTSVHGRRTPIHLSARQIAKGGSKKAAKSLKSAMFGLL
ncbi:MAG: PHP domain-containing protein [Halobacteria archaeon]|nr:PHP domain-containing protein [Halobacteria archaeon]